MKSIFLIFMLSLLYCGQLSAQSIIYSPAANTDMNPAQYEILGKYNDHYFIYGSHVSNNEEFVNKLGKVVSINKEEIIDHHIDIYDRQMNLISTENLLLPGNVLAVHFISYKDFCYMFYQYQHETKYYCMVVKINDQGKITGDPVQLTVTDGVDLNEYKLYNIICSEDKKTIAVIKITEKTSSHLLNYILFDEQLKKIKENTFEIPRGNNFGILSEFKIDNLGNIAFLSSSYSDKMAINLLKRNNDSLLVFDVGIKNIGLINAKLEINNQKKIYHIFSFYVPEQSNNVSGIISETWSLDSQKTLSVYNTTLSNELKKEACNECNTSKALNHFFIQNIFLQKDGGALVESENIYNGVYSKLLSYQLYPQYRSPYLSFDEKKQEVDAPWYFTNGFSFSRNIIDENILLAFYDSLGKCNTIEVIPKLQKDINNEALLGSFALNTGDAIEFIYSVKPKRSGYQIARIGVSSDKKIKIYPTIKDSISNGRFLCRFGKQVSANTVIIPGFYYNQLVFGKIDKIDSQ